MSTLSEHDSKRLLASHGVPFLDERLVETPAAVVQAAEELGLPVVVKLCGASIAHKTERGLVQLNLGDLESVRSAAEKLLRAATPEDGAVALLVAPMVRGNRELIAGLATDAQFGRTVMIGIGGIFTEVIADVAYRLAPLDARDAEEMIDDLRMQSLLGPFRGEPQVDRTVLRDVLLGISRLADSHPEIVSVDLNPLIVVDGKPVAVDALVEVAS